MNELRKCTRFWFLKNMSVMEIHWDTNGMDR